MQAAPWPSITWSRDSLTLRQCLGRGSAADSQQPALLEAEKYKHLGPEKACRQQPTKSTTHLSNTHDKLGNGSFYYAHFSDGTTNMGKFKEIIKAIQLRSNEAKTKAQMSGSNGSTTCISSEREGGREGKA